MYSTELGINFFGNASNKKNQIIYKFFSSDVLGYSSNMRDPLGFLTNLIKE